MTGRVIPRRAVAVASRLAAHGGFTAELGLPVAEDPRGLGSYLVSGPSGRTEVPGIWVAGNVTDLTAPVVGAAAGGVAAAMAINMDLITEDADRAGRLAGAHR